MVVFGKIYLNWKYKEKDLKFLYQLQKSHLLTKKVINYMNLILLVLIFE